MCCTSLVRETVIKIGFTDDIFSSDGYYYNANLASI